LRRFLEILNHIISIVSVASLFLCFASIYISPAKVWILAYFGLLFQPLFVLNILMLIIGIVRRKRMLIILHVAAFVPNIFFSGYFFRPFGGGSDASDGTTTVKLLSYNLQGFRIPYQKNTTQVQIAEFINSQKPDIVCLQEFYTNDNVTEELFAALLDEYKYHAVFYSIKRKKSSYGVATFSRFPIKMTLEIPFENTANAAMYTDINIDERIVRVYNVHLQSIKLNVNRLFSSKNTRIEEIEEVSSRLKTAFIKRAGQVDIMAKHIDVSPYPVIVCGDFNDTPVSYTYNKIRGDRLDTFCEAGRGMPSTYRLSVVPFFRIDYILHDRMIKSLSYKVHDIDCSDHLPVSSVVDVAGINR
jgi:endonuclease/exonuclease/phosphatase family metal-dependent hydrolase